MKNLKTVESHFAFGENWSEYSALIDDVKIQEAEKGLLRLVDQKQLTGKTFLDIGCGSGLHSLAALRLGVTKVLATDIDHESVTTTKNVLQKYVLPAMQYEVQEVSVFDLPNKVSEKFDIVYSWGVLHHTGDMYQAIKDATQLVKSDGLLVLALYRKTPMCGTWRRIKRWYTYTTDKRQQTARQVYIFLKKIRFKLSGRDFNAYKENYYNSRGMSFEHDVHDWMGGYPYESITPEETESFMQTLGFELIKKNVHASGFGLFGSGCDEFVFKKML